MNLQALEPPTIAHQIEVPVSATSHDDKTPTMIQRDLRRHVLAFALLALVAGLVFLFTSLFLLIAATSGPVLPNPGNPSITRQQQIELGVLGHM